MKLLALLYSTVLVSAGALVDFSDLSPSTDGLEYNSTGTYYYNGADFAGGFSSSGVNFANSFTDYGAYTAWSGFGYSNTVDVVTGGFGNQYSAITGGGYDGSADTYGVFYTAGSLSFGTAVMVTGSYFTNTTYSYDAILNGSSFSDPFGGDSGDVEDWFYVTIYGLDSSGNRGASIDYYLADYRFADNSLDYIVDSWAFLDLSTLGTVYGLDFTFSSSQEGDYGLNNPAYFAIDNLSFDVVPEPTSSVLVVVGIVSLVSSRKRGRL